MASWILGAVTVLAFGAAAAALVLGAIRRTARRQRAGLPPLPAASAAGPPLLAAEAAYLGTTYAPSSVRRFSAYGLLGRATVGLVLDAGGLRVERAAGAPWRVPAAAVRAVAVASHHAGKEVYADRVLVVDWQLGPTVLRSGFALDERDAPAWAARLRAQAAAAHAGEAAR
jgi:hypothetical protein